MKTLIIEVVNILFQKSGYILRVTQIEVEIKFILNPTIKSFNYRIVGRGSSSRHGA